MAENHNNSIQYPGHFLLTKNGTLLNPFHENVYLASVQFAIAVIGIPLNVILASAVLRAPELRSEPRNIFLLGVIFSSLSAFAPSLMDAAYVVFSSLHDATEFCEAYMMIVGISPRLMLSTTFISILDRYMAIWKPLWHRARISVVWASIGVVVTVALTVLCTKFVYIFGLVPLLCGNNTLERRILGLNSFILFALCLVGRVAIFLQTRKLLRKSTVPVTTGSSAPPINERSNDGDQRKGGKLKDIDRHNIKDGDDGIEHPDHPKVDQNDHPVADKDHGEESFNRTAKIKEPGEMSVLRRNTSEVRTRQMEMEAIKSLATGVTSLILLSCPSIIFISSMNICRCFSTIQKCSQYAWLSIFVRYLYQLYGIYHPALYLGWNKEFCHVLRTPLSRMASRLAPSTRSSINVTRLPPV